MGRLRRWKRLRLRMRPSSFEEAKAVWMPQREVDEDELRGMRLWKENACCLLTEIIWKIADTADARWTEDGQTSSIIGELVEWRYMLFVADEFLWNCRCRRVSEKLQILQGRKRMQRRWNQRWLNAVKENRQAVCWWGVSEGVQMLGEWKRGDDQNRRSL